VIIIGEKINATLPGMKAIIEQRDTAQLLELAKRQAVAGASFVDVNVGTGVGSREDEMVSMQWAVETIQQEVDTPLCIDSPDSAVLEAGLRARNGRPSLINSTNAEDRNLEHVVPLARQYQAPMVALAMDETGIPKTVEDRLRACEKIADACEKRGVSLDTLYFDPLVLPVSKKEIPCCQDCHGPFQCVIRPAWPNWAKYSLFAHGHLHRLGCRYPRPIG
jgi:5-methyltetrahydrofolate--homocysteine methyltransferase